MKRLISLLILLSGFFSLMAQAPYTISLADAPSDITATISEKEYFGYFILQNNSDSLVTLQDIGITPFLESTSGDTATGKLHLNGQASSGKATVAPGKTLRVEVRCELPEEGTYRSTFSVVVLAGKTKKVESRSFQVTYAKPTKSKKGRKKPFYQIRSIHTEAGSLGNLSVQMVVEDTSGLGGTISQVQPVLWTMNENSELGSADYDTIVVTAGGKPLQDELEFDEKTRTRVLNLDLSSIRSPGSYKGEVILSSAGAESVSKEFVVTVRRNWYIALLVISAGLIVSFLLRWLMTIFQPRLKNKQKVGLLLQQAEAFENLHPEEADLLGDFMRELSALFQLLDLETPADFATRLDTLHLKEKLFREWVQARRQVLALRPAELQQSLLPRLREAEDFIAQSGGDAATGRPMISALNATPGEIRKVVQAHIVTESTELAINAQKELKAAGAESSDIDSLVRQVEKVKQMPANTNAELDQMKSEFANAQNRYGVLLVTEMKEQLAQLKSDFLPPQTSPAEWLQVLGPATAKIGEAEESTDLEEKVALIKESNRLLLDGLTERLKSYQAYLEMNMGNLPEATADRVQSATDAAQAGQELLGQWNALELDQALERFNQVLEKMTAAWKPSAPSRGGESLLPSPPESSNEEIGMSWMRGPGNFRFLRPGFVPKATSFSMESTDLGHIENVKGTLKKLRRQLFQSELVSSGVIFVISAVMGLLVLWAPSPTWGSSTDLIYGALWGFGLHTVSKSTDIVGNVGQFIRGKVTGTQA